MKYWVLICFLLCFNLGINAQIDKEIELNIQKYTIQNGLPSNNINFSFQDYMGFIWVGTWTGLSKYNGYQFNNFNPNPNDTNSFKVGHFISYLKISDSIYFLTTKIDGILKLNVITNKITKIKNSPASPKIITKDKDGSFWIGTLANGFYHYLPENNSFKPIVFSKLTGNFSTDWDKNTVNSIVLDPKNDSFIWLGCRNGLHRYNKITQEIKAFLVSNPSSMHQFALNHITSLLFDKKGNIWAGKFFGGLGCFKIKTNIWEHYFFDPEAFKLKVLNTNIIINLKLINHETISITTSNGPMHFNTQTKTFLKYDLIANGSKAIGDVIDYSIDKDGNQWFSNIYQNGLSLASKKLNSTLKYSFPKQTFMPDYYGSVVLDLFWSKTYNRYFMVNTNHDGLLTYSKKFELLDQVLIPSNWEDKEPFPTSVAEDDQGMIWITDITQQLILYHPQQKKAINFYTTLFKNCSQLHRSQDNVVYFLTEKGLFKYQNKQFELILKDSNLSLISNIKNQSFFFLEGLNVFSFNIKTKQKIKLLTLPKFAIQNNNYIQSIFSDTKNQLWIPLEFGGVYLYQIENKSLKLLGFKEGLNNNTAREVKADLFGRIFILCNGGLYFFDEIKNRFIDFDNLTHQKINDWYEHGLFFTEDNELLVTKDNAFYIINQNSVLKENKRIPIITDLYSQENHFVHNFENILVPNYQNDVKIFFSNFDYSNPKEVLYEYQLNGFSKNWIKIEKGLNHVSFVNLKEGNYTFKVRLVGSKEFNICKFTVKSIWYKSQLFYLILSLFIVSVLFFSSTYYLRKKNKEKELQKRIAELKLISLQSQLNPHFLFNCLTSISGLIKTKEYEKSEKILNDFAKLMRAILTNSNKDLITLEEEIKISKLYLEIEKIRKNNAFDFEFKINSNIAMTTLVPPLILQPFLENSIKHGFINKTVDNRGSINIDIQNEENEFKIRIKDNGIGFSKENTIFKDHQSMGIEIQKERLEQYEVTHQMKFMVETKFEKDKGAAMLISRTK